MGVLAAVKQMVYDFVVWTGIMNVIVAIVKPFESGILKFVKSLNGMENNDVVVDASGHTMRVFKVNGRILSCICAKRIKTVCDIKIRPDDVLLCGYPKTGCHWMFEILHMLRHGKAQLSRHGKGVEGMIDALPDIVLDSLWSPRVLNSHLLYHELPSGIQTMKTKIILTVRNPKDAVVSYYNHTRSLYIIHGYDGSFTDYFKLFMEGNVGFGDYFDYYLKWEEITKNQKTNPIMIVPYEELKRDPVKWVMNVAKFLETPIRQEFAQEVVDACEFSKMKKSRQNDSLNVKIFRKGVSGDWTNWLTDDQSEAIDKRWKEKMSSSIYQLHT